MQCNICIFIEYCVTEMFFRCSCALTEEMDRLKSEMLIEQKKVKFYQAVLERTQEELESIRVLWLFRCF